MTTGRFLCFSMEKIKKNRKKKGKSMFAFTENRGEWFAVHK